MFRNLFLNILIKKKKYFSNILLNLQGKFCDVEVLRIE
jgi:hypothetical protein